MFVFKIINIHFFQPSITVQLYQCRHRGLAYSLLFLCISYNLLLHIHVAFLSHYCRCCCNPGKCSGSKQYFFCSSPTPLGMEFDLTPLPSTTDVSFVYNTPTPFVVLHSFSPSDFQKKFSRSRQLRYRWCDSLLCSASLLMVYNLTPWYHGCSNSTTVDHSTSMETSQRHFIIVPGAFLGNVLTKVTRPTWERKSARVDRTWLFCVG